MRKIIWVTWYTEGTNTIGIVITENETKENRAYIGLARGIDSVYDMEHIAYWGAKFSIVAAALLQEQQGIKVNHILKVDRQNEK